jgi:pimeloyl-ACP methyl ester carboxylesterase
MKGISHSLISGDITLYLWEKYIDDTNDKPVIVLCTGGVPGKVSFDLQIPDKPSYSMMDYLASEGFDTWTFDPRCYGLSTQPEDGTTTVTARNDLNLIVDYICKLRTTKQINLVGWSWGASYGGMLAMKYPDKVSKYVCISQNYPMSPGAALRRRKLDWLRDHNYVATTESQLKWRFYHMTPEDVNDSEVVDTFTREVFTLNNLIPTAPTREVIESLLVHPRLIKVPTLMIEAQYDDFADADSAASFFKQLPNPHKMFLQLPDGGHMLHLQKGHKVLQHYISAFCRS